MDIGRSGVGDSSGTAGEVSSDVVVVGGGGEA